MFLKLLNIFAINVAIVNSVGRANVALATSIVEIGGNEDLNKTTYIINMIYR